MICPARGHPVPSPEIMGLAQSAHPADALHEPTAFDGLGRPPSTTAFLWQVRNRPGHAAQWMRHG